MTHISIEMITFNYETNFKLKQEMVYKSWITEIIVSEKKNVGELNYIFCDDAYLLQINIEYLQHDYYTDIITFDYTEGNKIQGDVFISVERVKENAENFKTSFEEELLRVMSHGILHLCGYGDKTEEETSTMREKENQKIKMFHVERNV